jgi:hypothetical protein
MPRTLAFESLTMMAESVHLGPRDWSPSIKKLVRSLGLPIPAPGQKIGRALAGQATEIFDDKKRNEIWRDLCRAGVI